MMSLLKPYWRIFLSKGTAEKNVTYCSKDTDVTTKGSFMKQGARSDISAALSAIADGATLTEMWREHGQSMVRYHRGLERAYLFTSPNTEELAPPFPLDAYVWTLATSRLEKSVILWGEPGIGKTCFARSLLPNALIVTHMDDLKRFDRDEHDGIIFDDMEFKHIPRTSQIHIVDMDLPRSIHCRFECAHIPANTKKIFTTNEDGGTCLNLEDGAIRRRVNIEHLQK